jgi:cell division protein FtsW (lipid II flippase)
MLLQGDPRWTHRRRLVYGTVGLAWLMIVVAMLDVTDRQVSSQLVIGAVSLLSIVLTAYTVTATYDDKWRADHEPSDFD